MKLDSLTAELPGIISEERLPMPARLRAVVILASTGDKRGAWLLEKVALSSTRAQLLQDGYRRQDTVLYALRHLNQLLGERALPVHREAVGLYGSLAIHLPDTFAPFGSKAIPYLTEILQTDPDPAVRDHARYLLRELGKARD